MEEQSGFRKARACVDHVYSITTAVRNRMMQNNSSFACYIDFQKAFDFVNRNLLAYHLLEEGIGGKFYWAIQSLYEDQEKSELELCWKPGNQRMPQW